MTQFVILKQLIQNLEMEQLTPIIEKTKHLYYVRFSHSKIARVLQATPSLFLTIDSLIICY